MAKSNGRTQRPQRTSRNSSKADVDTTAQPKDEVETVEDTTTENLTDEVDSDTVADDTEAAEATESAEVTESAESKESAEAKDSKDTTAAAAKKSGTAKTESKKTASAKSSSKASDTKKSETKKSDAKKSDAKKSDSAKGSSKRTSRSGNPAKRPQGRKTASYTSQSGQQTIKPNPRWFLPVLIGLLLIGLIWLVAFYVSQGAFPVEAWGNWNILIGFAFFVAGLIMSTRWR